MCTKNIALTIAGFDPGSGAGISADLKTFAAHHIYGVACISALTVQSTLGVQSVETLSPSLVRQTLQCLAADVILSGIKIGMLGCGEIVAEVSNFLAEPSAKVPRGRIVLDPVLRSSSGTSLIDANGISLMRNQLLQRVGWITPNIQELAVLVEGDEPVPAAASRLRDMAARLGNDELNVVVTGGNLDQPNDFLLTSSGEQSWFRGRKVVTSSTHGTGCAFSSALLCGLLLGSSSVKAVESAKEYVTRALETAYPVGQGKGPINHLFPCEPKSFT
ncbi:MAG: bifunctional hydroxymethylpyrimidine kinase/phosphomethylpyrimidine kinase [Acidobacteriaceae bacterium]